MPTFCCIFVKKYYKIIRINHPYFAFIYPIINISYMDLVIWWIEHIPYDPIIFDILIRSISPPMNNIHYVLDHMHKNPWKYNPKFYNHFFDRIKIGVDVNNIDPYYFQKLRLFGSMYDAIKIKSTQQVNMKYVIESYDMDYVIDRYSYIAKALIWYLYNMSLVMITEIGYRTVPDSYDSYSYFKETMPYFDKRIAEDYIILLYNLTHNHIDVSLSELRFIRFIADEMNKFTYPWNKFSILRRQSPHPLLNEV